MKRVLFVALLCASAAPAAAQQFCVSTSSELQSRIFQAHGIGQANPKATIEIRLRRSAQAYVLNDLPDSVLGLPYPALSLRGGYDPDPQNDCTDTGRVLNAANTAVTALSGVDTRFSVRGDFLAEGLHFDLPRGLEVNLSGNSPSSLEVVSNIFEGGEFIAVSLGKRTNAASPDMRIVNNVVSGTNHSDSCAVYVTDGPAEIANNTISSNNGTGVCYRSSTGVRLDNNIIWANSRGVADKQFNAPSPLTLVHNILQSPNSIPGPLPPHIGGLSTNPNFVPGSFRPATNSPAINSGAPGSVPGGLPSFDIEGNARVIGAFVDRGAFESFVEDTDIIVVNTQSDTLDTSNGKMSLRSALMKANSDPGVETIRFAIGSPALCEARIAVDPQLGALPEIEGSVVIDGYSQGQATPNSLSTGFNANICIAVTGTQAGDGLVVPAGSNAYVSIKGLRLAGFANAIRLSGGGGHAIEGNSFEPMAQARNITNISVEGNSTAFIGGSDPAERNLLSGAINRSVVLLSNDNFVVGNKIGPAIDGVSDPASRNGYGISVNGNSNRIDRNEIIGNVESGIFVNGSHNEFTRNQISSNARGIEVAFNAVYKAEQNILTANEISYNAGAGVSIGDGAYGNRIEANRIHDNGALGIDLSGNGQVESNGADVGAVASTKANRSVNFPVLVQAMTLAGEVASSAQALGVLNSANGTFVIDFYATPRCDGLGHGEGEEPIGTTTIQITNAGQFTEGSKGFSVPLQGLASLAGKAITATATDASGNTSEFSACVLADGGNLFGDGFEAPVP